MSTQNNTRKRDEAEFRRLCEEICKVGKEILEKNGHDIIFVAKESCDKDDK